MSFRLSKGQNLPCQACLVMPCKLVYAGKTGFGYHRKIARGGRINMRGAMLYVNAGKGHYMPAKALSDSMTRNGHEAILEELFVVIDAPFWKWFCKYDWRFLLHHPNLERFVHPLTDTKFSAHLLRKHAKRKHYAEHFRTWYEREKPDFIVSTNFIGGIVLPEIAEQAGVSIPIFSYSADVFDTPIAGITPKLTKLYLPSELGCKNAIKHGQKPEEVEYCSFPLQKGLAGFRTIPKQEARLRLGLKDKFTVLFALGGEGIGRPKFLYEVVRRKLDWQVVAVGKMSRTTKAAYEKFARRNPHFDLVMPGFVDNINEYLCAADVQVGKAGANALMESIYLHRPCLISELLYAARSSALFLEEYGVGWCENNIGKQVDIVEECFARPEILEEMESNFQKVPLKFGADAFIDQLIAATEEYNGLRHGIENIQVQTDAHLRII
jgi:processive 1,2-diacylglycerol beta-glucosyltransferase